MQIDFNIDKIVQYLDRYKSNLPNLYNWQSRIDKLINLEILTENQVKDISALAPFEKELQLKKIIGIKLNEAFKSKNELFDKLCLWVIKDWGRITAGSDIDTIKLVRDFLKKKKLGFNRIASTSKVAAYMSPDKYVIYDARVAYSLNWIILSENAGQHYFPIPEGRNSKMSAFDVNVLIRLKNISFYQISSTEQLDQKQFINNADNNIFIDKKEAYTEMNKLVKQINQRLWAGDKEKEQHLYYTEMLLFSIADREVFMDITKKYVKD